MPRRSIAVLGLALLALLLGCWLWFGHAPQRPALPSVEPAQPAGDPGSPNVSTPQNEESRSAEQATHEETRFRADTTRVEGRHELLVQRREDGAPLAGVEVFALQLAGSEWSIGGVRGPLLTDDLEKYLAERGQKQVSDANGIALVPEPEQTLVVCARKDALWGWTSFERGTSEPAVLELAPAHDLDVLVRGADGAPQAGARVQLARLEDPSARWLAATGADGKLRVRNVEALLADQGLEPGELGRVGLLEPFDPPVERWIDPRALPNETIELVLPACGSLRVRVVGKPGVPLPIDGELRLRWTARPGAVQSLLPLSEPEIVAPLVDGEARVPHVAIGGRLMLKVAFPGNCTIGREVDGPRQAGEEAQVELALDARDALLVIPVQDEQGAPLALRDLEFARYEVRPDRARLFLTARTPVRTDAEGRLRWVLPIESRIDTGGEPSERIGWLWLVRPGQPTLAAEVDLRGPFASGPNERPPVVLKPDPPLVQGRVIDEQDKPLANVTVALSRIMLGAPGEIPGIAPVRTDAGGEFEFHGPCLGYDLQLEVFAPDHRLLPGDKLPLFRCGTSPSFEIRMQLLGRLRGRVLTDPGVGPGDIALRVEHAGVAQSTRELRRLGNGFAIEFDGLAEGEYTLIASSPSDQSVFASVGGLVVKAGETCRDARLDPLDLRRRIPTSGPEGPGASIRVLDEQGRELDNGLAWIDGARRSWAGGRVVVPADATGELALVATHTGIGRVALEAHPTEVRLPPALHARFTLQIPADLRARSPRISLPLGFASSAEPLADQLFANGDRLEFDSSYELAIELAAPLSLKGAPRAKFSSSMLVLGQPGTWEIRAADGEQHFAVELAPAEWERLRTALAQQR